MKPIGLVHRSYRIHSSPLVDGLLLNASSGNHLSTLPPRHRRGGLSRETGTGRSGYSPVTFPRSKRLCSARDTMFSVDDWVDCVVRVDLGGAGVPRKKKRKRQDRPPKRLASALVTQAPKKKLVAEGRGMANINIYTD